MLDLLTVNTFHKISATIGSGPLLCTLQDGARYYCKKNNKSDFPYTDLINELLFNQLLKSWGIEVPEIAIAHINFDLFENEITKEFEKHAAKYKTIHKGILQNTYIKDNLSYPLFACKEIKNQSGLPEDFIASKESFKLTEYNKPEDILLIGFFDLWISNKDRKPRNPNIISDFNSETLKKQLIAIDHCQALNKNNTYGNILVSSPLLSKEESILSHGFSQKVVETMSQEHIDSIIKNAISLAQNSLSLMEELFNLVPQEWGLNESHKREISSFLSDKGRLDMIVKHFKSLVNK